MTKFDGKYLVETFSWEIFSGKFLWIFLEEMPYLISLILLLFRNIAYIGFGSILNLSLYVSVCLCLFVYFLSYSALYDKKYLHCSGDT